MTTPLVIVWQGLALTSIELPDATSNRHSDSASRWCTSGADVDANAGADDGVAVCYRVRLYRQDELLDLRVL